MSIHINEVDKVEILTLQDNYIDLISRDNTEVVLRSHAHKRKGDDEFHPGRTRLFIHDYRNQR